MAEARLETAGELVAALAANIPAAVWAPGELLKAAQAGTLNPFREPQMSEAMRKHLEGWERDRFRAALKRE